MVHLQLSATTALWVKQAAGVVFASVEIGLAEKEVEVGPKQKQQTPRQLGRFCESRLPTTYVLTIHCLDSVNWASGEASSVLYYLV
jgi:hypothetical protein